MEQGRAATAVLLPSSCLGSRGASPRDPQAIGCDALPKPSPVQSFPVHYVGTNLLGSKEPYIRTGLHLPMSRALPRAPSATRDPWHQGSTTAAPSPSVGAGPAKIAPACSSQLLHNSCDILLKEISSSGMKYSWPRTLQGNAAFLGARPSRQGRHGFAFAVITSLLSRVLQREGLHWGGIGASCPTPCKKSAFGGAPAPFSCTTLKESRGIHPWGLGASL